MIRLLRSIVDNLNIELIQVPLLIVAGLAIAGISFLAWYLYWSWLVNYFAR